MNGNANSYLLDTNILVYYFNGEPSVEAVVNQIIEGQAVGYYCPLTWGYVNSFVSKIHIIEESDPLRVSRRARHT
jgi:predicted nucleic acid-binding protein